MKYTPQECARLCSKIHNFYGKSCTHFTRQWISTDIDEHEDSCGRDGDDGFKVDRGDAPFGDKGSAGVGTGKYTYRGQCIFYDSPNHDCCSTKAAWREVDGDSDSDYCQAKYGERKNNWDNKNRSWRKKVAGFSPTVAWPVTSLGRRLESTHPSHFDGERADMHELLLVNGTSVWVAERSEPMMAA
jgi:hypothetical protein